MRYLYFFQDKHARILLSLQNGIKPSVLLWQNHGEAGVRPAQNVLTFCFTKMYFYCVQINNHEKDHSGNYKLFRFYRLRRR